MTPPERLVQAAAEAMAQHTPLKTWQPIHDIPGEVGCSCGLRVLDSAFESHRLKRAIAAAFAALPVDEIRKQAREAVNSRCQDPNSADDDLADAASDAWVAALARFGEPT